ncbi:MAG: type I restriction-modification system subunit M N-terminal domain-containing protein [Acidobacteria bacterium]|nr:type I restriction-modification system subunit M N-terminal domain-containing protein [Acidobacteriota bacterium]
MASSASHASLPVLEGHLWAVANILRGPVDAADFKSYIFPLLFFKRISDVFDEEFELCGAAWWSTTFSNVCWGWGRICFTTRPWKRALWFAG